jgi:hypothetical protein
MIGVHFDPRIKGGLSASARRLRGSRDSRQQADERRGEKGATFHRQSKLPRCAHSWCDPAPIRGATSSVRPRLPVNYPSRDMPHSNPPPRRRIFILDRPSDLYSSHARRFVGSA